MKRFIALFLFLATASALNADSLYGTWKGTSLCTNVRPACHDEIAVYHLSASSHPNTVMVMANKVVDGKEVEMGGPFEFQRSGNTLSYEMTARDGTRALWTFIVSGDHMTGTLKQMPGGEVVRNIALKAESREPVH